MSQKVIDLLNAARARELTAISQYMIQHYELEDKAFGKLGKKMKEIAIQEMKHAEELAERILFLNGEPTAKPDAYAQKGQDLPGMMNTDIALEAQAISMYNDASLVCAAEKDQISKELFEKLLNDEEGHIDFFQNTKDHIDRLGAAYIATLTD